MLNAETVSLVVARISSIPTNLNKDEFTDRVVRVIQHSLRFHFVGFYSVDVTNKLAILQAGSGEVGKIMLRYGHHLSLEKGWVKEMVHLGEPRLRDYRSLDIYKYPKITERQKDPILIYRFRGLAPSPLIPKTKWQLFLPCSVNKQTVGLLEIHKVGSSAFNLEEVMALQTLSHQITLRL